MKRKGWFNERGEVGMMGNFYERVDEGKWMIKGRFLSTNFVFNETSKRSDK